MITFAYGANLDVGRMRALAPAIRFLGRAYLPDHAPGFTVIFDGIPGEDAIEALGSRLWGVLYELPDGPQAEALDASEGIAYASLPYRRERRSVITETGARVDAWLYLANRTGDYEPDRAYVANVLDWARFWNLPPEHLTRLEHHLSRARDWR